MHNMTDEPRASPVKTHGTETVSPSKNGSSSRGIMNIRYRGPNAQPPWAAPCPQITRTPSTTAARRTIDLTSVRSYFFTKQYAEMSRIGDENSRPRAGESSKRYAFEMLGKPIPKTPWPATSAHSGKLSWAYDIENGEPNSVLL
jgi:hypothetical protein